MYNIFFLILLNLFLILEANNEYNISNKFINEINHQKYPINNNIIRNRNLDYEYLDKKNVIITIIKSYTWSLIKPFFISLLEAKIKNYDLIVFVDNLSEETLNKIKLCGAIVKDLPQKNLGFQDLIKYRWKIISDFLKENKDKYNLVFCTDVRDVIFQKDIFQYYKNSKPFIGFTLEDITLHNPVNKNWVKQFCTSNHQYNKIADERVICGGTIIASVDKFIEFSDILWETIKERTNVFDQGAINYLIYYKKIMNDSIIKSDNNGPIMTICVTKRDKIDLDSDNNVLNFKGKVAAVVHQYDRKPDMVRKFNKKYNDAVLNKYFSSDKINEANKVKKASSESDKIKQKNRMKIIKKIILFSFIIISSCIILYCKARRSGLLKREEKTYGRKRLRIKKFRIRKKKTEDTTLSTSGGPINEKTN